MKSVGLCGYCLSVFGVLYLAERYQEIDKNQPKYSDGEINHSYRLMFVVGKFAEVHVGLQQVI